MADSVIEPAENSSANVAPVEDLLQTASLQNCQRLVVLGSARSGKSSLVARWVGFYVQLYYTRFDICIEKDSSRNTTASLFALKMVVNC